MCARNKDSKMLFSDMFHPSPCLSIDQLIAYSEDRVSDQDRFSIENHLADCEFCSDALDGLSLSERKINIRQEVEILHKEIIDYSPEQITKKQNWKVYFSLAAIFVLALLSVLYIQNNNKPQEESLFTEYFKPYPNMIPIVRGEESDEMLQLAMVEYENENYKEALSILKGVLAKDSRNDTTYFYAGISSLSLNDPQTALTYFQKVVDNKNSEIIDQATWYQGLTYLKLENVHGAESAFNKLASQKGAYREESAELLTRLK